MLRFLAKLVLLFAALFFALLLMVAGLGMVGALVVPFLRHNFRVGLPADAQFVVYSAIPRLSMVAGPVVLLCFLFCLVLIAWRVAARDRAADRGQSEAGESRMVQEIYQGLSHLEERVEALETILMARAGEAPGLSSRLKSGRTRL